MCSVEQYIYKSWPHLPGNVYKLHGRYIVCFVSKHHAQIKTENSLDGIEPIDLYQGVMGEDQF